MKSVAAIEALERLKDEGANSDTFYHDSGAAESWKARVRSMIIRSLGANHYLVSKLDKNIYELEVWTDRTTEHEFKQAFAEGMRRACGYIDAAIYELRIDAEALDVGGDEEISMTATAIDAYHARRVFVVHGRNAAARNTIFTFLRSLGLDPIEWSVAVKMTGEGSPYIGQVLDAAFAAAQAVVVLLTPDDIAYLRSEYSSGEDDPETKPLAQARPNVLFEAGMAMGRDAKRTVLVEFGNLRAFSDVAGRHAVRIDGTVAKRKDFAQRLQSAGCDVNLEGEDWLTVGDFTPPPPPGGGAATR